MHTLAAAKPTGPSPQGPQGTNSYEMGTLGSYILINVQGTSLPSHRQTNKTMVDGRLSRSFPSAKVPGNGTVPGNGWPETGTTGGRALHSRSVGE